MLKNTIYPGETLYCPQDDVIVQLMISEMMKYCCNMFHIMLFILYIIAISYLMIKIKPALKLNCCINISSSKKNKTVDI